MTTTGHLARASLGLVAVALAVAGLRLAFDADAVARALAGVPRPPAAVGTAVRWLAVACLAAAQAAAVAGPVAAAYGRGGRAERLVARGACGIAALAAFGAAVLWFAAR